MNKTQGKNETSPKEKEKLKKRLQTLFKQQENEPLFTGHSNKTNQKAKRINQQINGQPQKTSNKLNNNANKMKAQANDIKKSPKDKLNTISGTANPPKTKKNGMANNYNKGQPNQELPKLSQPSSKNKKKNLSEIPKSSTILQNDTKPQLSKKKNSKVQSLNSSVSNGQQNMQNNSTKKAKKRTSTTNILNSLQPKGKKAKLTKKLNNTKLQNNKPLNNNDDKYDLSNMSGYVPGGIFDSDSDDESYKGEEGDSNVSNFDSSEDNEGDMELYDHNKSDVSEDDDSSQSDDGDSNAYNFDSSDESEIKLYEHKIADSSEEGSDEYDEAYSYSEEDDDDEHYSDFDENDYEEDEDSYDYSYDSDGNSSSYDYDEDDNDMSYDFEDEENDGEYNLPKSVLEDLIIHRGTATKHDLKPEDNVVFNSDNEGAQVIELEEQQFVKVIKQPKAYEKEEMLKLKYVENTSSTLTMKSIDSTTSTTTTTTSNNTSDSEDCPKLVPIVDEDGFQLYNPNDDSEEEQEEECEDEFTDAYEDDDSMENVSLGSEYMEINSDDADSMCSEDINEKYLNRGQDDDDSSDSSVVESVWIKQQKVDVIDATSCKYMGKNIESSKDNSDNSLNNDDIRQIPSQKLYAHVDLNTKGSFSSTTINEQDDSKTEIENDSKSFSHNQAEVVHTNSVSIEVDESTDNVALDDPDLNETLPNENEDLTDLGKTTAQNLTNYNTKFYNALDSNIVLVLMKDPFYIYGTVRLTLLAGALDVYGHTLALNKEVEIFSPRGCSVIEIASLPKANSKSNPQLKDILKMYEKNFALADLKLIIDSYDVEKDAVVLLKRNDGRRKVVQQFKKFMNENVFPNINNINMDRPLYNTEYLLRCMINTSAQTQKCLRLPTQWQQLSVRQQSRIMLTGGKGVGKSTLLRYLINRHLPKFKQILLIDLDIGQPEIFVPQTVSCSVISQPLLGPGFLLNLQTDKSFAVGHTNIALCAHKYLEAVRSLISYCVTDEKYKEMPWLINTMGYNKGFGLELISVIAKEIPLTDVIQLQSSKDINNFDGILFAHVLSNVPRNMFIEDDLNKDDTHKLDYRLHVWQSAVQQESRYLKEWEMSAKDLRYATLLARLSEALHGHAEWLTDCKPLSAPLDQIKIVNLMENTATVSQAELAKAIEANLVYLCRYEVAHKPMECFGIGIVRGIDFHVQQLYLVPAMPASQLKLVNCLAIGEMALPTSILTNQGSRVKNLAPFVYNTIAAKSSKAIKQIYHRPRKFLTGVHKSLE